MRMAKRGGSRSRRAKINEPHPLAAVVIGNHRKNAPAAQASVSPPPAIASPPAAEVAPQPIGERTPTAAHRVEEHHRTGSHAKASTDQSPAVTAATPPTAPPLETASKQSEVAQPQPIHDLSSALVDQELIERQTKPPAPLPEIPRHYVEPPLLFECAWEVCWQLGGIYTVIRTKAAAMLERWGDRYCLIGPYNPETAQLEFEEQPTYGSIRETLQRLREGGLNCYFGRWLVPGRPRVILLDYRSGYNQLDHNKYLLWRDHGIETYAADGEVNEVAAFGFAVTEFFRLFTEIVRDRPVLATSMNGWRVSRSPASRICDFR